MQRPRAVITVVAVLAAAASAFAGATPATAQARAGSLSGVVHDTRGALVRDALIVVYPSELSGPETARTTTDDAGAFAVPALPAGSYKILIGRGGWFEWAPGRITDPAQAKAYRVFPGHRTVADSVVTAPGVISGRVTTPAGRPAPAIGVTVEDLSIASSTSTSTAADGSYAVSLPPGTEYVVTFTNGELTQLSPRVLDYALARRYTVRSGRTTRVDERLLTPATLTGRLVDEFGAPVAGASVLVAQVETAGEVWGTTGSDGRYRFDTMPPGNVKVGFTAPDGRERWAYHKASYTEADLIALSLGTVTTVDETLLPLGVPVG